jgi:hypothetical protein
LCHEIQEKSVYIKKWKLEELYITEGPYILGCTFLLAFSKQDRYRPVSRLL